MKRLNTATVPTQRGTPPRDRDGDREREECNDAGRNDQQAIAQPRPKSRASPLTPANQGHRSQQHDRQADAGISGAADKPGHCSHAAEQPLHGLLRIRPSARDSQSRMAGRSLYCRAPMACASRLALYKPHAAPSGSSSAKNGRQPAQQVALHTCVRELLSFNLTSQVAPDVPDGSRGEKQGQKGESYRQPCDASRHDLPWLKAGEVIGIVCQDAIDLARHRRKGEHIRSGERDQNGAALGIKGAADIAHAPDEYRPLAGRVSHNFPQHNKSNVHGRTQRPTLNLTPEQTS